MTFYEILQVAENASDEVIRMAYKALAKKYHPDIFQGDPQIAEEKMKQINAAFEVLSDKQKRAQYDAYLHGQDDNFQTNNSQKSEHQSKPNVPPTPKREFVFPSGKKSGWIIGILLFLSYVQVWHPYSESNLYDYSFLLGTIGFCLLNILMMSIPLVVGLLKDLSPKQIKVLCSINSIAIYVASLLLYICGVIPQMLIGWIIAVFYYYINKHILLQVKHRGRDRRKVLLLFLAIFLVLLLMIVGGTYISGDISRMNYSIMGNQGTNMMESEEIEYDSYYVGVRTISLSSKQTAQFVIDTWKNAEATESSMITLMDQYGAEQGGGQLYLIQPGELIEEVDSWCFDRNRQIGDVAIIENDYGYTICYFSSVVER